MAKPLPPASPVSDANIPLARAPGLVIVNDTPKGMHAPKIFNLLCRSEEFSGRGVFTTQPIKAGTVVETSPVLVLPIDEVDTAMRGVLGGYTL